MLLHPKQYLAPVFHTSPSPTTNAAEYDEQNETEWTLSNQKEIDKEKKATFEPASQRYLPKTVWVDPKQTEEEQPTSMVLAVSIRMNKPKYSKTPFRLSRILVGVLGAMKKVYKDTYLGPIEQDTTAETIVNLNNTPLEIGRIKQYLATPVHPKQGVFTGKIYLHTNHTLQEYRQNEDLVDYLRSESIIIDINDLDDINPVNVGYMDHLVPRFETIDMHTQRLYSLLPANAPKLQLQFMTLWGKSGDRTRVVMVKCDEQNRDVLQDLLEELNQSQIVSFFSWTDYLSCTGERKTTLVNELTNGEHTITVF
jgi:hypothetical protein